MRFFLVAAALIAATSVRAQSPRLDLSDVLKRHLYAAAYDSMTEDQTGLPAWMRTAAAAQQTATSPGRIVTVDGRRFELYQACKPHDCGGNELVVLFTPTVGGPAKALLASHGRRFLGAVSKNEQQALISGLNGTSDGLR